MSSKPVRKIWLRVERLALAEKLFCERSFEEYLTDLRERVGDLRKRYGEPDYIQRIEKLVGEINTVMQYSAVSLIPEVKEFPTHDTPSEDEPYP